MQNIIRSDTPTWSSRCKDILFYLVARVAFSPWLSPFITFFVNHYEKKTNRESLFPFIQKRKNKNINILIYHRVNDEYDLFFPATPINVFRKQMEYIRSRFFTFPLEEITERMKQKDVPDNSIVVTFDDGYLDNYENAFPVLKEFSIPATIFLATGAIDTGKILWHDHVFSAFRETKSLFLEEFGTNRKKFSLINLQEKLYAQGEILKFLRTLDTRERLFWIDILKRDLGITEQEDKYRIMMNWGEIKEMYRNGISFGGHTITHPILSRLSANDMKKETFLSKKIIEYHLESPINTFAYPNGTSEDFNEMTKKIVKDAGYSCAVTTIFGTNDVHQDVFALRRGTPWDTDIHKFGLRLQYYKFCS
jgi:peptidoglycan/xylan/chitin deacetylase (PgdA/CDA1 family)